MHEIFADNRGVFTVPKIPAERIIVIMPNWLGDGVMATPFLRALRGLYPAAHIAAIHKPLLAAVLNGLPFVDRAMEFPEVQKGGRKRIDSRGTVALMRDGKFDLAILLPNSFRSALLAWGGKIPHRVGYAREWRSPLLTDRLPPVWRTAEQRALDAMKRLAILELQTGVGPRVGGVGSSFQPLPTIDYYLEFARYLGAADFERHMELGVTEIERNEANSALEAAGFAASTCPAKPAAEPLGSVGFVGESLVVMVPGANFGSSKCWPPERFAAVADALIDPQGAYRAKVVLAAAPAEKPVVDAILAASKHHALGRMIWSGAMANGRGISVGALKEIVRRSRLMICNDTGPRHFSAAFNVPTVALFGPTDQRWAETFATHERCLQMAVPCGPCQLKRCPIDHRCMNLLTVDAVLEAVAGLWK